MAILASKRAVEAGRPSSAPAMEILLDHSIGELGSAEVVFSCFSTPEDEHGGEFRRKAPTHYALEGTPLVTRESR